MSGRDKDALADVRSRICTACAIERSRVPVLRLDLAADDAFALLPHEAGARAQGGAIAVEEGDCVHDREAVARLSRRARRDPQSGCLVWSGGKYAKSAYGAIQYKGVKYRAHRLAFVAHKGPIANGLLVCHACDNPACIAIEHLFLGTPKDNMADMRIKGRGRWRSKLSREEVARVKRRLAEGATMAQVARETGIRYSSVFAIRKGRNWRDVAAE